MQEPQEARQLSYKDETTEGTEMFLCFLLK